MYLHAQLLGWEVAMNIDDERLSKLMMDIDPAVTPPDSALTPQQLDVLANIKAADEPMPQQRRPRKWWRVGIVSTVLAACVVAVLVLVPTLTRVPAASALTPAPLDFAPLSSSPEQVLDMAKQHLSAAPSATGPRRAAAYTGWYLQVEHLPKGKTRAAISPQVTELSWSEDGSGTLKVTAGDPYWANGDKAQVPVDDAPEPGTILSESDFGPGEFDVPVSDEPGSTVAELTSTLQALGMPSDADTFTLMESVRQLLTLWTLTNAQHESLLSMVLQRDDVKVLGTATDRDGRNVVGITADSTTSDLRDVLLISTATGRVIGFETIRTTEEGDVPAGAVVAYTLWKDTPQ